MRKHKVYLGKPYHHQKVPRLLRRAAINAYALEVERYLEVLSNEQLFSIARSTGKSTFFDAYFSPLSILNQLEAGTWPVTFRLFATKLPRFPKVPAIWQGTVVDRDVEFMYTVPVRPFDIVKAVDQLKACVNQSPKAIDLDICTLYANPVQLLKLR